MWLLLLFIHAFALAGFNLSLRKSLINKVDPFTLATVMQTGIAIPLAVVYIFRPVSFDAYQLTDYMILALLILLTISLHISNVKALQYLEKGVYSIIYNLRLLIVTVLGILFLSEDVVWLRILGGVLIFLAIVIVKQKGNRSVRVKGFEWGIIAAFVISFLNLTEKTLINNVGILNYFPFAMIAAAAIMWTYLLFIKKEKVDKNLLVQPQMLQLMVLRAVSAYGFPFALASGALLSVANYISGLSVIIMVALGALLLGERDYLLRKTIATGVAVLGLTIILISGLIYY